MYANQKETVTRGEIGKFSARIFALSFTVLRLRDAAGAEIVTEMILRSTLDRVFSKRFKHLS